ncbi:MaoC/PaaZ C-terminal domain-containing protein [Roseovarius pacificus]|uniref:MaoC/PaaZ C-terminal domain-containing protein n=1 Tax=Roseovarius pacificus TaxID=337701 RepID=UPI002A18CE5F|nr:MaoC/PaaZ C-terminal domain-containing protein [Roseovarius pacificus]
MKQPTTFHDLIDLDLGAHEISWTERDAIVYALACGADASELDLVYERDLRPLPGFLAALGLWAVERCGDLGVYDRKKSLHVSQKVEMHTVMPAAATLPTRARVAGVWDKGKVTILDIEVTSDVFTATYTIFLPGIGGWGGPQLSSSDRTDQSNVLVETANYQTTTDQAALYRMTGDLHPVHIDPAVAASYGFERPILHGLCTLGIALRLLAKTAGFHPAELKQASAKLSAPVLPGDLLTLRTAHLGDGLLFDVKVGERQVLKDGYARFAVWPIN